MIIPLWRERRDKKVHLNLSGLEYQYLKELSVLTTKKVGYYHSMQDIIRILILNRADRKDKAGVMPRITGLEKTRRKRTIHLTLSEREYSGLVKLQDKMVRAVGYWLSYQDVVRILIINRGSAALGVKKPVVLERDASRQRSKEWKRKQTAKKKARER